MIFNAGMKTEGEIGLSNSNTNLKVNIKNSENIFSNKNKISIVNNNNKINISAIELNDYEVIILSHNDSR